MRSGRGTASIARTRHAGALALSAAVFARTAGAWLQRPPTRPVPSAPRGTIAQPASTTARGAQDRMEQTPHTALTTEPRTGEALTRAASVHAARRPSVRRRRVGAPHARRSAAFRQDDVEFPKALVAERHEHRRPEVLPRAARLADARALGQADDLARRGHDRRLGARARLLRLGRGRRRVRGRAHAHPAAPDGGVQLAGLVQRRLRGEPRSARPASSSRSTTRWSRSSPGTPRRG